MDFEPVKKRRIAEDIAATMRDAILGGQYEPGAALPPERELARQFGVNRSSIREALHRLEGYGLIDARQGDGTRVRGPLLRASVALLPYLLAPGGELDPRMMGDLLEIRSVLLGWVAAASAGRRDDADLVELRRLLSALEEADDPATLQALDWAFFERLVSATRNRVMASLAEVIAEVYRHNRELFVALYAAGLDLSFHRAAADAIEQGDAQAAREAMEAYGHLAQGAWSGGGR